MSITRIMQYEVLRSIDSTTFTGSLQAVGTPLENPASIVKMVNNSTSLVTVSIDGINDHDVLPPSSFFLYDETANQPNDRDAIFMPKGTQFYVSGAAGTGSVYLVVQYILRT